MKKPKVYGKRARVLFFSRFVALISHPLFWVLTIIGNTMIVLGGVALYVFESKAAQTTDYLDFLLWSTSLVTTVGYKTYVPATNFGKITVLLLMMLGTFFLWAYMAFLVTALISPALSSIEKEVQDVEEELSQLKTDDFKLSRKETI